MVKPVQIADGEIDPAAWGKAYPREYELWKKTEEPRLREKASIREASTLIKSPTTNSLNTLTSPCFLWLGLESSITNHEATPT